jgi:hypothetical protein
MIAPEARADTGRNRPGLGREERRAPPGHLADQQLELQGLRTTAATTGGVVPLLIERADPSRPSRVCSWSGRAKRFLFAPRTPPPRRARGSRRAGCGRRWAPPRRTSTPAAGSWRARGRRRFSRAPRRSWTPRATWKGGSPSDSPPSCAGSRAGRRRSSCASGYPRRSSPRSWPRHGRPSGWRRESGSTTISRPSGRPSTEGPRPSSPMARSSPPQRD